ncbi:MAG: DEAD/DEAH box helicase [Treponema sp.]|nr:DEAD/DEAH box helicase [Treponema sp.]
MEFSEINLHPDLKRGITDMGYITCMPVQEQVLASAFGGEDLYVQSQTGTGKTAAFLIVIFQRLLAEPMLGGKKAIIMVPTRELAVQVEEEAKALGKYLPFKSGSFYGGVGYAQQQRLLKDNVQILVGTPGRVLDLNKSGHMNLMDIAFLVLDEADRMFDMGFYPDLRKLIRVVPPADRRQTMLFSATLNAWVKNLAWEYTKNPKEIEIEPETVTVDEVDQILYHVPSEDKMKLLLGILDQEKPESAIIFCNTKRYAEIVAKRLRINGVDCEFIIGDLPQVKRLKIIDDIKVGHTRFLVATDVAARGLDIEGLALVVNFDLPVEAENYVHRIGRTARAGKTGKAVTLASEQDVYELPDIEKYIGKKVPSQIADESLYGEDKSEGVRIKTDYYDDRRRDEGPRSARRSSGRSRDGGSGRGDKKQSPEKKHQNRDRAGRKGYSTPTASAKTKGTGPARQDPPNLAGLPFDERMAYYKEKYERQGTNKNKPAIWEKGRKDQGQGDQGQENRSRRSKHRKSAQAGSNISKQAGNSGSQPIDPGITVNAQASASKEEKQGIFGKFFGIFNKQ